MPNYSYCEPHKKVSREVTNEDIPRVLEYAEVMHQMCHRKFGINPGAFALAHAQLDDQDPLRFFVTHSGQVIVNPKIVRHTQVPVRRVEGCMSFPMSKAIAVDRFNKCEVEFQTIDVDELSRVHRQNLSGRDAEVFQHECDHFDAKYVYGESEGHWKSAHYFFEANKPKDPAAPQAVEGEEKHVDTAQAIPDGDGEVRGEMPASEVRDSIPGGV